jgi:hypothetical protein
MSVSCECCVLPGRNLCGDRYHFQRDPAEFGSSVSDLDFSAMRGPLASRYCHSMEKKYEMLLGQIEVRTCLLSFGA